MNREELYRLALSGPTYKSHKDAIGFDDCEKYLDAFSLKLNQGPHIPVWIVYLFYYRWAKESGVKPERYSVFVRTWGRHTRSIPYGHGQVCYRAYKIKGFPKYTVEDELKARKLIREQKEKIRNKARRNKEILQSKS